MPGYDITFLYFSSSKVKPLDTGGTGLVSPGFYVPQAPRPILGVVVLYSHAIYFTTLLEQVATRS